MSKHLSEVQDKLDSTIASELPTKLGYEKALQELALLQEQNSSYAKEAHEKQEALMKAKAELAMKSTELKGRADILTTEAATARDALSAANQRNEAQSAELQSLVEQLRTERTERAQYEQVQKRALEVQEQMAQMAHSQIEGKDAKIAELKSAVQASATQRDEAQQLLSEAQQKHDAALEQFKLNHQSEIDDLKAVLASMSHGTSAGTQPLGEVVGLDSAANEYMPTGSTLSEVYSRLAEARQQLLAEQQQVRTLQESMEFILKEVEAKAPVIERQKQDFDNLVRSHSQLSQRLAQASSEKAAVAAEVDAAKAQAAELEVFNKVLEKQAARLAQQLQGWVQNAGGTDGAKQALLESEHTNHQLTKKNVELEIKLQSCEGQHKVQ